MSNRIKLKTIANSKVSTAHIKGTKIVSDMRGNLREVPNLIWTEAKSPVSLGSISKPNKNIVQFKLEVPEEEESNMLQDALNNIFKKK